jgi:hypothetical protein
MKPMGSGDSSRVHGILDYDKTSVGRSAQIVCPQFQIFDRCFHAAIPTCTPAEISKQKPVYEDAKKNVLEIAPTCPVSTAPDFLGSSVTTANVPGIDLKVYQWILAAGCACCCCTAVCGLCYALLSRRKSQRGFHVVDDIPETDGEWGDYVNHRKGYEAELAASYAAQNAQMQYASGGHGQQKVPYVSATMPTTYNLPNYGYGDTYLG